MINCLVYRPVQFTGLFDVLNDTKIAEDAINSVIETRQDLAMALQFPGRFDLHKAE